MIAVCIRAASRVTCVLVISTSVGCHFQQQASEFWQPSGGMGAPVTVDQAYQYPKAPRPQANRVPRSQLADASSRQPDRLRFASRLEDLQAGIEAGHGVDHSGVASNPTRSSQLRSSVARFAEIPFANQDSGVVPISHLQEHDEGMVKLVPASFEPPVPQLEGEASTTQESAARENDNATNNAGLMPLVAKTPVEETQLGMPIDLPWALQTAAGDNPQVLFANARIREAYARQQAANAIWLPHIQFGASLYSHLGVLQNAIGDVIDADRSALFTGFGARASGTGAPRYPGLSSQFHLGDAYYQPQIAAQRSAARRQQAAATTNDILLATSNSYLDLLQARQLQAIVVQTRKEAEVLATLTNSFAKVGQGPQADADRAQTELKARQIEVEKTRELARTASARLSQNLSLDDRVELMPVEQTVTPIDLVASGVDRLGLIEMGLNNRHELAGRRHLVAAACAKLRREQTAAFAPNLGFAASYGGFGGGRDEGITDDFDHRLDVDAFAFWSIRNFGVGERAARCEAAAQLSQARAAEMQVVDQIVREVSEAQAKIESRQRRIDIAREGIEWAENAYRRDLTRIREGEGFPIEALTSLRAMDRARRDYLQAIVDFNQAQFELQRAIGWPGGAQSTVPLDGPQTVELAPWQQPAEVVESNNADTRNAAFGQSLYTYPVESPPAPAPAPSPALVPYASDGSIFDPKAT